MLRSYEEGIDVAELYERMYDVFHPYNKEGAIALVALILLIIFSAVCRKQFGGFFSAFKSIFLAVVGCGILWWIHPAFCIAVIVVAVLQSTRVIKGNWPWFLIAIALVASAIWKYFL